MRWEEEADWRRRGELKSLLLSHRSRLGRRSRTGGKRLRQQDAAIMTGLSVRSYAALESGTTRPSRALIDAVASGLRMTPAERSALHVLATGQDPPIPAVPPGGEWPAISPDLRALVSHLDPMPAAITDEMWTIIARNQTLTALTSGWFDQVSRDQQNLVLFLFSPQAEQMLPDVHTQRRTAIAGLRYQYTRNIGSKRFAALIGTLLETGPEARTLWERHEIDMPQRHSSTRVRHPRHGLIEARTLMTALSNRTWMMLTVLTPAPPGRVPLQPMAAIAVCSSRDPPGRDAPPSRK